MPLTCTELLVMQALVGGPGVVRSRDARMDAVHGAPVHIDDRAIDVHIKRMRMKLKAVNDSCDMIDTVLATASRNIDITTEWMECDAG